MMGVFVQLNADTRHGKSHPIGYVIQENGCWEWVGAHHHKGYGMWDGKGIDRLAHREMYKRHKGPIAPGLQIDHLCKNPPCVNPDHLEAVTQRENNRRSDSPTARNAKKRRCPRGHPYVFRHYGRRKYHPQRICLECGAARALRRYHAQKLRERKD